MTTALSPPNMSDDPSLSLNIICEARPCRDSTSSAPRKKVKKNKYEKRRERSKKAKQQKANKDSNQNRDVMSSRESDAVNSTSVIESLVSVPIPGPQTTDSVESMKKTPSVVSLSPTAAAAAAAAGTTTSTRVSVGPVPLLSQTMAPSRKKGHVSLEDEEERAKYMAEYHARPLEMDRRYGAVRDKIKQSADSSHIFDSSSLQGLHPRLWKILKSKFDIQQPTVIQSEVWKAFSASVNQNLFIQSETGSGKTLGYLLPIVQNLAVDPDGQLLQNDRHSTGTRCVILCPTRELASQTFEAVDRLLRNTFGWLVAGCISGGEKRKSEKQKLRKGISVLVATPGRFLDHLQKTESLLLSLKGKLEFLVLDEADRLLDMGLGGQIEQIVQHVRANQPGSGPRKDGVTWRSMLVSATVTPKIQELAKTLLGGQSWIWTKAAPQRADLDQSTPQQLRQLHLTVNAKLRLTTLLAFLAGRVEQRSVVFMSTCDGVDYHHQLFQTMNCILPVHDDDDDEVENGVFGSRCPIFRLHGNVPHSKRQATLKQFNSCSAGILLATDVAARGLNLRKVDWTVQYDPPCEVADYAHRAGRAARAGRAGHSLLFLLPSERKFLEILELKGLTNMTAISLASTLNQAASICPELTAQSKSGHRNKGEAFCAELQRRLEDIVMNDDKRREEFNSSTSRQMKKKHGTPSDGGGGLLELARKAFLAYIRAYPTKEKTVRSIFVARSLHMGHIARSFALKEAPKTSARAVEKKKEREESEDWTDDKHRLEFNKKLVVADAETEPMRKRTRREERLKSPVDSTNGTVMQRRILLMERAQQLQREGMNSL